MNPGPPIVGLPISPLARLLLADLEHDVHAGARVAVTEGTHPDGEQVVRDGVGRNLEVVDVTVIDRPHEARGIGGRGRERLYRIREVASLRGLTAPPSLLVRAGERPGPIALRCRRGGLDSRKASPMGPATWPG